MTDNNSYINYQNMVTDVTNGISKLEGVCRHLSMEAQAEDLGKLSDRLKKHIFSVGIMGEFKRGKSTVINALLGQKIVPANVIPCSATLNYIKWDANKRAEVHFKDGRTVNIEVEELENYVTKLTEESEATAENVEDAVVYYPCQFCQNGIQIVDTPGLNDDERMTEISEKVIPTLDAIIMVVTAKSPFSMSEAEFVRNKVMTSDMGRIIFLVNQIDTVDEDERDPLIRHIKSKIQTSVLEKTAAVHGEDSDIYKATKDKIGSIRLLPVSALQALKSKTKNKPELYDESGYPEFEKALTKLLTEERGALELLNPVNHIISTSKQAGDIIKARLDALSVSAADFEKIQKDAINTIEEAKKNKRQEIKALKSKGKTLYADLLPEVSEIYAETEGQLIDYVNSCDINASNFADKDSAQAFSDKVSKEISSRIQDVMSIGTERLSVKVKEQLGTDIEALNKVGKEINAGMNSICMNISNSSQQVNVSDSNDSIVKAGKDILIDAGVNFGGALVAGTVIPGIGGAISGFRNYGLKGGVAGGAAAAVTSVLVGTALASVSVVGLPMLLIMGATSAVTGRAIPKLLFGKSKKAAEKQPAFNANAVREQLLTSVRESVQEIRNNQEIEKWLKNNCENMYNAVADNIDAEWENQLKSMEDTLTQAKIDLQMNKEAKAKTETEMAEYSNTIENVLKTIQPICDKLNSALSAG